MRELFEGLIKLALWIGAIVMAFYILKGIGIGLIMLLIMAL